MNSPDLGPRPGSGALLDCVEGGHLSVIDFSAPDVVDVLVGDDRQPEIVERLAEAERSHLFSTGRLSSLVRVSKSAILRIHDSAFLAFAGEWCRPCKGRGAIGLR